MRLPSLRRALLRGRPADFVRLSASLGELIIVLKYKHYANGLRRH